MFLKPELQSKKKATELKVLVQEFFGYASNIQHQVFLEHCEMNSQSPREIIIRDEDLFLKYTIINTFVIRMIDQLEHTNVMELISMDASERKFLLRLTYILLKRTEDLSVGFFQIVHNLLSNESIGSKDSGRIFKDLRQLILYASLLNETYSNVQNNNDWF